MKLKDIRQANEAELILAVKNVIKNQHRLTLGEMHATTRTIYDRAKQIGVSIDLLNKIARGAE